MLTPRRISLWRQTFAFVQIDGCVICCATVSAVTDVMRSSWKVPGGRSGAGVSAGAVRATPSVARPASTAVTSRVVCIACLISPPP
jgi:hypothetical protein